MGQVPDWLTGVWRRLSLETPDQKDTTTDVVYLQTPSCYGDLRIPIDRPSITTKSSLIELTPDERVALARQKGFSGVAQVYDATCQWFRAIDYQPPQPVRDIGLLYWKGDILIEDGIDAVYQEEWQKIDDGGGDFSALVLFQQETSSSEMPVWQASIVTAGDRFIYTRRREQPLPTATALSELVADAPPEQQCTFLDCEISYGLCQTGEFPWQIQRSTLPWREGQALWSLADVEIDLNHRQVLQNVHDAEVTQQLWSVQEWGTGKAFNGSAVK